MADEPAPETGEETEPETGDEETDAGNDGPSTSRRKSSANDEVRRAVADAAKYRRRAQAAEKALADSDAKSKSEMQQLISRFDEMEERAKKAEHKALVAEIAEEFGLSVSQARRLSGETREELVSDAEELIETFGVKVKAKPKSAEADDEPETGDEAKPNGAKPPAGKPKEKLRGGATPSDAEPPVDYRKVADQILADPL